MPLKNAVCIDETTSGTSRIKASWDEDGGYYFVAYLTPLLSEEDGGKYKTHMLVTLLKPFDAAYVLKKDGPLSLGYVEEKFPRYTEAGLGKPLQELLCMLLDRKPI